VFLRRVNNYIVSFFVAIMHAAEDIYIYIYIVLIDLILGLHNARFENRLGSHMHVALQWKLRRIRKPHHVHYTTHYRSYVLACPPLISSSSDKTPTGRDRCHIQTA
jgi:hypothetical protein